MGSVVKEEERIRQLSVPEFYTRLVALQPDNTMLIVNAIQPWMSKHTDIDEAVLKNALTRVTTKDTTIAFWPTGGNESFVSGKLPQRSSLFGLSYPFIVGAKVKQNGSSIEVTYRHEGVAAYGVARDPHDKRRRIEVKSVPRSAILTQNRNCEIIVAGLPEYGQEGFPFIVIKGETVANDNHKLKVDAIIATEKLQEVPYIIERTYQKVGNNMVLRELRIMHTSAYQVSSFEEYMALTHPSRGMVFKNNGVLSTSGKLPLVTHKSVSGEFIYPTDCDVVVASVNEKEERVEVCIEFEQYEQETKKIEYNIPLTVEPEGAIFRTLAEYDLWKNQGSEGLQVTISQLWSAVGTIAA